TFPATMRMRKYWPRRGRPFRTAGLQWISITSRSNAAQESARMARKLKTYQTSLGFFDLAVAAPSMKAALEAWGADSNLFHQGAAKESADSDIIEATMAKPGVVLRRAVGSDGSFGEHAQLPTNLGDGARPTKAVPKSKSGKAKRIPARPVDKAANRKAALAFENEQKRRERERAREEAARQKERER